MAPASSFQFAYAQKNVESEWVKHVIKPPRPTTKDNTVPSMVWVHDVDGDGKKDLIGQGYQPFHNGNKWYKCPDNPTHPWNEWCDYGVNLKNGHDIRLRDINGDGMTHYISFFDVNASFTKAFARDLDEDGDIDFVYSGVGGGFLGWFENTSVE